MKLFNVNFTGVYPVGNCLVILADDINEANVIAKSTLSQFTSEFTVTEVDTTKSGIVVFLSGDY